MGKKLSAGALALGLIIAAPLDGHAAPRNGDVFDLVCDGSSYEIVTNGRGNWTPGHVVGSTAVFIPTGFGVFTGEIFDDEGNFVEDFQEGEPQAKGRSASGRKNIVDCTFEFSVVSDGSDPEFPLGYTFVGSGAVSGFFSR